MKMISVHEAVGTILCHDITKIVPGEFKGRAFKKGHMITCRDIPELLKLGKEHLYVWEAQQGKVHENDAALRLAKAIAGEGLLFSEVNEGKIQLTAAYDGLFMVDEIRLLEINCIEHLVVATRNNLRLVQKGDVVAGLRVVPLTVAEHKLADAERIAAAAPVVRIKPLHSLAVGVVTTGSEVYFGRIEDKFLPVLQDKLSRVGCRLLEQIIVPDDRKMIAKAIRKQVKMGAEMVVVTGGMSVDPDDVTPAGIIQAGAEIVLYGAPVLPGAMLLVSYLGEIPVLGLPGCVMYSATTVFDLLLPLILAGEKITRPLVAKLGMGGLCLQCPVCRFPACSFGSGA